MHLTADAGAESAGHDVTDDLRVGEEHIGLGGKQVTQEVEASDGHAGGRADVPGNKTRVETAGFDGEVGENSTANAHDVDNYLLDS